MTRFHCTINIFNPFFQWRLNNQWRINSVWFYDYDSFFEKFLSDLDWGQILKFKLNLFNWYKSQLSYVRVSEFINGDVLDWYSIVTHQFDVPSNVIACCCPSRKIRDKYFDFDCLREKYYVKSDFIYYLKS